MWVCGVWRVVGGCRLQYDTVARAKRYAAAVPALPYCLVSHPVPRYQVGFREITAGMRPEARHLAVSPDDRAHDPDLRHGTVGVNRLRAVVPC